MEAGPNQIGSKGCESVKRMERWGRLPGLTVAPNPEAGNRAEGSGRDGQLPPLLRPAAEDRKWKGSRWPRRVWGGCRFGVRFGCAWVCPVSVTSVCGITTCHVVYVTLPFIALTVQIESSHPHLNHTTSPNPVPPEPTYFHCHSHFMPYVQYTKYKIAFLG